MTQIAEPYQKRREEWVTRVCALVDQVKGWCQSQGWDFVEDQRTLNEELLGQYAVTGLRIHAPGGTIYLNPVARHIIGGSGRVDLEAFPTLSRVKLVDSDEGWRIITDSNVPLRQPWNEQTFVQLVADLLN